jgi:hypothetical protein
MKAIPAFLVASALLLPMSTVHAQSGGHTFTVHANAIGNVIALNGGGRYEVGTGFLQGGGGFRVTNDITGGPLAGLRAGDAGHWEAAELLPSSGFKCGFPGEAGKTATTDDDTVVLNARFFRDGDRTPLTAKVFFSAQDEDPIDGGSQDVWIQNVGCDEGNVDVR